MLHFGKLLHTFIQGVLKSDLRIKGCVRLPWAFRRLPRDRAKISLAIHYTAYSMHIHILIMNLTSFAEDYKSSECKQFLVTASHA